jgi:8-oxo-dGTP diphosphatase
MKPVIHVAVGAVLREDRVLLSKRAIHQHQGGLWEFPGGKVDNTESVTAALVRELREELAIEARRMEPLIQIPHDYGDKCVLLDVWVVTHFGGEPQGQEGQPVAWVKLDQLKNYQFPAANRAIVSALQLPHLVAITPSQGDLARLTYFCEHALSLGAEAVVVRVPQLNLGELMQFQQRLDRWRMDHSFGLWLNSMHLTTDDGSLDLTLLAKWLESGWSIHLKHQHIKWAESLRPLMTSVGTGFTLTASCHDQISLVQAAKLGIDAAFLSPVLATNSHQQSSPLGWSEFARLVAKATIPVFGLGGLSLTDVDRARQRYAQGIAGITLFCD